MKREILIRAEVETVRHRKDICADVCRWLSNGQCTLFRQKLEKTEAYGLSIRSLDCHKAEQDMDALKRMAGE